MSVSYTPLHGPNEEPPIPASLDGQLRLARRYLDTVAESNIHDHTAMLKAAAGLDYHLRALIAAVTAERGEGQ
ncbi:hypothetical protein AB0D57_14980 [Streptomyces sp. NPDC048275]|uniref:hypothetical protein n=1 Tax=Streptomyces sp. NPDC048275 TaxID=3155629 RepID=UPI00340FA2FA